jgi:hypothetical protein
MISMALPLRYVAGSASQLALCSSVSPLALSRIASSRAIKAWFASIAACIEISSGESKPIVCNNLFPISCVDWTEFQSCGFAGSASRRWNTLAMPSSLATMPWALRAHLLRCLGRYPVVLLSRRLGLSDVQCVLWTGLILV